VVKKTVSDIGERGLIQIISEILGGLGNDILSGEDDAVAIKLKDPSTLVINTDMLVSTTDVPPQMTLYQAARKAVVMTVSDVLVKGAIPKWAVVALGLPENLAIEGDQGFRGLIEGLKAGFHAYGIEYLGGDLNETKETVISCTIFGEAPNGVISRSDAQPGDIIICTGEMGKTGCGFSILLDDKDPDEVSEIQKRQFIDSVLNPTTPIEYGKILLEKKWVTASCDSSDGISTTIKEICKASQVGAKIYWNMLPIAKCVEDCSSKMKIDPVELVFNAGEEFIHIYTIPKEKFEECTDFFSSKNNPFHQIGEITDSPNEILLEKDGIIIDISNDSGYEHLKKKE